MGLYTIRRTMKNEIKVGIEQGLPLSLAMRYTEHETTAHCVIIKYSLSGLRA